MADLTPPATRLYRLCDGALRVLGFTIVPRARRRDWTMEWRGELWHHLDAMERAGPIDARARADVIRHVSGALPHALWMRRDQWRLDMMMQDLAYALRTTIKRPGFTAVVVATLALGIGANTAMFGIVNSILIKPLPYANADQLVYMYGSFAKFNGAAISPPDFLDYRARNDVFSAFAARTLGGVAVLTGGQEPERVDAVAVTANFFATLGVAPMLGRGFLTDEESGGGHDVVILSYGLWRRRFGGDPRVVGTTTLVDGRAQMILGVMPASLDKSLDVQLWQPVEFGGNDWSVRRFHFLRAIGRLAPGVSIATAQSHMDVIAKDLERTYKENETWKLRLVPHREVVVGTVGPALVLLLGAVGLVLLIACANVASLMLARATSREGEIAVRTALGASRTRLVRQLLTESLLLGIAGGALGLALAFGLLRAARKIAADILPRMAEIQIDGAALAFTLGLSLATAILFGLAPALHATRGDAADAMRAQGKSSGTRRGVRLRDGLVVGQVALSLVLLAGAGLLMRSLWRLEHVNAGFDSRNVLTAQIGLPAERYATREKTEQFWTALLARVRALPGVESAAQAGALPLSGGNDTYYWIEGHTPSNESERRNAFVNATSDGYFATMRIPVIAGRPFDASDEGAGHGVVIINQSMGKRLFPDGDALGKRLVVDFGKPFTAQIVGVVRDIRQFGLSTPSPDMMFFSLRQSDAGFGGPNGQLRLAIRTRGDPSSIAGPMRAALKEIDPDVPLADVRTMVSIVIDSVSEESFRTRLLGAFAGVALVLAVFGLYGVLAYSVSRRTRELGVRMALGAPRARVFSLVVRQGMTLVALGLAVGLLASIAATRLLSRFLFEVDRTDPLVLGCVAATLALAGLAACVIPARRATKVDLTTALRGD